MPKHTGRHLLFKPSAERSDTRWLLGQVQNIVIHTTGRAESRELVARVMAAAPEDALRIMSEYVTLVDTQSGDIWRNGAKVPSEEQRGPR